MKRTILLLAVLLVAASCSVTRDRSVLVSFADYTAFPDMWISPNPCPLTHTALGELAIDVIPAIVQQTPQPTTKKTNSVAGYGNPKTGLTQYEVIHYDELLAIAVKEARNRGANGISNLHIGKKTSDRYETRYEITGILITIE